MPDSTSEQTIAQHTPGPWKVIKPDHGHETDYLSVQVGEDESYTTLEMKPSDAQLVAAAPDLLAAVHALLAYEQEIAQGDGLSDCTCINWSAATERAYEQERCPHQLGRQALNKAEARPHAS